MCLSVCLSECASEPVNQTLNAKTVIGMDFKFGVHVSKDSPNMIVKYFLEKGAWPGSCDPEFFGVKCLIVSGGARNFCLGG